MTYVRIIRNKFENEKKNFYVMPERKALRVGCGEEPISFKIKVLKYKINL